MADDIKELDDVWLNDDVLGIVLDISKPFRSGNVSDEDGPMYGREYTIFVPEDEPNG